MDFAYRKNLRFIGAAAVALTFAQLAIAQTYPTRPITLIVAAGAGGSTDVTARIVSQHMSGTLGQRLIIENVAAAGGTTGSIRAMRAKPDGYTIQMGQLGTHAAAVALYPALAYRPDVDFEPIGIVAETAVLIVARKDMPPNNLTDFISYAKAHSEQLNMAHGGVGSIMHVTCLLFNSIIGLRPTMVPFTSGALAMNALVAGHIDYMCGLTPDVVPQVQAGTIKTYAISSAKRNLALPNVSTSKEAGLSEFQPSAWYALFAPRETPKPILDKLADALDKALDEENTRKRLFDIGSDVPDKARPGPAPLAALVKSEIARWTPIIKAAGIKGE